MFAGGIQHHKAISATCTATGITAGTWVSGWRFEVYGVVEAGCEGLFQIGVWPAFIRCGLFGIRGCLPAAVLTHGYDFTISHFQRDFTARPGQDLLTFEQALAFKYLALSTV